MASRARVAKWAAERAAYQLANRGDSHFAADRRLYKRQLTEMRKEWLAEDLLQRRTAYVAKRDAEMKRDKRREKKAALAERKASSEQAMLLREERESAMAVFRENERKRKANERKVGERTLAMRQAKEDEFRAKWLEGVLADYDVDGNMPTNAFSRDRKRAWINPENFDKKLPQLMIRTESPVDMWNLLARKLQSEEEREALNERLGGRLQPPDGGADGSAVAGADATAALAAKLRAMTTDGALGPGGDAAAGGASGAKADGKPGAAFLENLTKTIADLNAPKPEGGATAEDKDDSDKKS